MPKQKRTANVGGVEDGAPVVDTGVAPENTETETPKTGKKSDSVVVIWYGGVREYNKQIHGDNFRELAQELADQFPGSEIK